jgi:hypothetical protein
MAEALSLSEARHPHLEILDALEEARRHPSNSRLLASLYHSSSLSSELTTFESGRDEITTIIFSRNFP